jgi:16S rRNA G966 N2-methylase RsmD
MIAAMRPENLYHGSGTLPDNFVFYGDNLDAMRRHVRDETIDLVYLDPPFTAAAAIGTTGVGS